MSAAAKAYRTCPRLRAALSASRGHSRALRCRARQQESKDRPPWRGPFRVPPPGGWPPETNSGRPGCPAQWIFRRTKLASNRRVGTAPRTEGCTGGSVIRVEDRRGDHHEEGAGRWSASGRPEIESTDHIQGIAPVPRRVRPDPGRPGQIIAVRLLLESNSAEAARTNPAGRSEQGCRHRVVPEKAP